jgi:hypothetical protein
MEVAAAAAIIGSILKPLAEIIKAVDGVVERLQDRAKMMVGKYQLKVKLKIDLIGRIVEKVGTYRLKKETLDSITIDLTESKVKILLSILLDVKEVGGEPIYTIKEVNKQDRKILNIWLGTKNLLGKRVGGTLRRIGELE